MDGATRARSIVVGAVVAVMTGTAAGPAAPASAGLARSKVVYTDSQGLTVVDAAGGPGTALGEPPGAPLEGPYNPRWSPDGSWIAFMHQFHIWVVRADGSGMRQLTWVRSNLPSWSANGKTVYYTEFGLGGDTRIGAVNLDGSAPRDFGNPTGGNESMAQWSPDGSRVAFASHSGDGKTRIYVMTASGAGLRPITDGTAAESPQDWSPDGRTLLVSSLRHQRFGVEVMDGSGGNKRTLATDAVPQAWAPNGERILAYHSSTGRLKMIRTDGTAIDSGLAGMAGTAVWGPGSVDPEPGPPTPPTSAPPTTRSSGLESPTSAPASRGTGTSSTARAPTAAPENSREQPPGTPTATTAEAAAPSTDEPVASRVPDGRPTALETEAFLADAVVGEGNGRRAPITWVAALLVIALVAVHSGIRLRRRALGPAAH